MPATCRHRIVRRAVMALVVVVLLVSGYVGSWCGACFLHGTVINGKPILRGPKFWHLENTVFWPIVSDSGIPGASAAERMGIWCYEFGRNATWIEPEPENVNTK